jgi:hypothetical protein
MGRKKQINGSTLSIDLPPPAPVPPPEEPKKKRELSDKQRENLSKGMAILKAKREAKSKKDDVEVEPPAPVAPPPPTPVAPPPAPVAPPAPIESISRYAPSEKKERKPRTVKNYLTAEDFNSFKTELLTSLKPNQPIAHHQPVAHQPVAMPTATQPIVKERLITGSELLNKIFKFN